MPTSRFLIGVLVAALVICLVWAVTARSARTGYDWHNMVVKCEARGLKNPWYANTGNGYYFGIQFKPSTWHSSGGGPVREMGDKNGKPMKSYSIKYIIRIAENTMRIQGRGAWPDCNGYL